jgi:hypothetical protein
MDQVLLEVRDSTLDPPRRPEVPQACHPLIQALMQVQHQGLKPPMKRACQKYYFSSKFKLYIG